MFENPFIFWTAIIVIIFSFLLYLYYSYAQRRSYEHWGVPMPKAKILSGHMHEMVKKGMLEFDKAIIHNYGSLVEIHVGNFPNLITTELDLIKQIFVKEAGSFVDRRTFGVATHPMKYSLTSLKGNEWKRVRNLLTPTFTTGKLKNLSPLVSDSAVNFVKRFEEAADKDIEIDIKSYCGGLSMEVIARSMFGLDISCQTGVESQFQKEASTFFQSTQKMTSLIIISMFPMLGVLLQKIFPSMIFNQKSTHFFVDTVEKAIKERRSTALEYHDFLALMLKAHSMELEEKRKYFSSSTDIKGLTNNEILAQALIFMLAGYETTAATLTFCLYFMAMNQDIQNKVRAEIEKEAGDEPLTYENTSNLDYLEMCIQETLRLTPPAVRLERVATSDVVLTRENNGQRLEVKKGTRFTVPVMVLHRDPNIWDKPEEFRPERFLPEEKDKRHSMSYMPFGAGPRNCIGFRFANLEMKFALAAVLRSIRFVTSENTPAKLNFLPAGLLTSDKKIVLKAQRIHY